MQTARELYIHELTDLFDAEQRLVKALGEQERDAKLPELKKAFSDHRKQTENHVKRLQQVFKLTGESPEDAECKGIKGIVEERASFKKEDPSDDLLAVFDIGAAIKVETYEICAYNSIIGLAEMLDEEDAIDLLQQNLNDEEETLERMQDLQDEVEPESLGLEGSDDDDSEEEEEDEEDLDDSEEDEEDEDEEAEERRPAKSSRSAPKKVQQPKKGKNKRVA